METEILIGKKLQCCVNGRFTEKDAMYTSSAKCLKRSKQVMLAQLKVTVNKTWEEGLQC